EGVSKRTLTKQLRDLEEDGVLSRTVFPEVPPRVEYAITSKGETLLPIIKALYLWGESQRATNS
ncbi:MAG: helix-turn-helix transcriptional regulator, partial [Cyclobacteriaceae bacterium]|nr:helix-turn-helix transcriptional regulator [Cyclobacteriaceae bacterium HetDA_MAG_MS6]